MNHPAISPTISDNKGKIVSIAQRYNKKGLPERQPFVR